MLASVVFKPTNVTNTSSDYRVKENIVNLTGATERLPAVQPKRFNFIGND